MKKYLPMFILVFFGIVFFVGFVLLVNHSKQVKVVKKQAESTVNSSGSKKVKTPLNVFNSESNIQTFIKQSPRNKVSGYGIADGQNGVVNITATITSVTDSTITVLIPDTNISIIIEILADTLFQSRPKVFKGHLTNKQMLAQIKPFSKDQLKPNDTIEVLANVVSENKVKAQIINLLTKD